MAGREGRSRLSTWTNQLGIVAAALRDIQSSRESRTHPVISPFNPPLTMIGSFGLVVISPNELDD